VIQFLSVFLMLFGPKIGRFDMSFLGAVGFMMSCGRLNITLNKTIVASALAATLLLTMLVLSQIAAGLFELDDILRMVRVILFMVILDLAVSNAKNPLKLFDLVFLSATLHCAIVIIAANLDPVNEWCAVISGNDRIRPGRASGLLAGFDIAGLFAILGLSMLASRVVRYKWPTELLLAVLFLLTSFYSSRISMTLALAAALWWGLSFSLRSSSWWSRLAFMCAFSSMLLLFTYQLLVIADVSLDLGLLSLGDDVSADVTSKHAIQPQNEVLWFSMYFLPESFLELLLGTGRDVLESDVGYIKEIYRYGLIGLAIVMYVHWNLARLALTSAVEFPLRTGARQFVMSLVLLTFLLSTKNGYFFTRAIFPFYLTSILIVYYSSRKELNPGLDPPKDAGTLSLQSFHGTAWIDSHKPEQSTL
jgi:hypothetical protein